MPKFGAKRPVFAPIMSEPENAAPTYGAGIVLGRLVKADLAVNLATGELYSDDALSDSMSEFSSGTVSMENDDMTDNVAHVVYNATITDGALVYSAGDEPPYGGLGYYKVLSRKGIKKYQAIFYHKVKASVGNDAAATKGNSITYQTESIAFTIYEDATGAWREVKTFDTENAAAAWLDTKLSVATWYALNVTAQGMTGTDAVSPVGVRYATAAGSYEITITGTPTALYDNGTNGLSAITGGKYTISNITANHEIAVIF